MVAYNLHNNKNSSRVFVTFNGIPSIESMGRKENIFLVTAYLDSPLAYAGGFLFEGIYLYRFSLLIL